MKKTRVGWYLSLDIKEVATKMVSDLMKQNPIDPASKAQFYKTIAEYEDMIFKKYCVINPETEYIKEQINLLKKQYEDELKADKFLAIDEEANYLKEFQEFDKPPIIPEEVAQTEYYRPNPAAFQKRINDNPYAVDVGFSSLENPIYTKLDDFPARMNTRANSQFYDPREQMNRHKIEYPDPVKPFVQKLNTHIFEKMLEHEKHLGAKGVEELYFRGQIDKGVLGGPATGQVGLGGNSIAGPGGFGFLPPNYPPQGASGAGRGPNPNANYQMYDLLRDPEGVDFSYLRLSNPKRSMLSRTLPQIWRSSSTI